VIPEHISIKIACIAYITLSNKRLAEGYHGLKINDLTITFALNDNLFVISMANLKEQ
jgi:hypothetical protein